MDNASAGYGSPAPGPDRRKSERKREFTAGFLADRGGAFVLDCLIRDVNATGAQIRASLAQPIPDEAYLVNLKNRSAFQAHAIWRRTSLAGFGFKREYVINDVLPVHLEFLRSLFIAAKLRQVDQLTSQGMCIPDALSKLGVTQATYFRWCDALRQMMQ